MHENHISSQSTSVVSVTVKFREKNTEAALVFLKYHTGWLIIFDHTSWNLHKEVGCTSLPYKCFWDQARFVTYWLKLDIYTAYFAVSWYFCEGLRKKSYCLSLITGRNLHLEKHIICIQSSELWLGQEYHKCDASISDQQLTYFKHVTCN